MGMKTMPLRLLVLILLYVAHPAIASDDQNSSLIDRSVITKGTKDDADKNMHKLILQESESELDMRDTEHKPATKTSNHDHSNSSQEITKFDQVGGHHGIKIDVDGLLLKPSLKPGEFEFYENVANTDDDILREVKSYIPEYHGTKDVGGITHLRLRNIIEDYVSSCIMDIKIGYQIWDPAAEQRKIDKRELTYVDMRNQFHFCIQGFKYYDIVSGERVTKSKKDLKQMVPEDGIKTIYQFVNGELGLEAGLVKKIVKQLQNICSWFERQEKYTFYASSIFITYDSNDLPRNLRSDRAGGATLNYKAGRINSDNEDSKMNGINDDADASKSSDTRDLKVRVRMIDFNHALKSTKIDENYLSGIRRLIKVFQNLDALHKNPKSLSTLFPQNEKVTVRPES